MVESKKGTLKNHAPLLVMFAIISIVFIMPLFMRPGFWGQMDWDQFVSWNAIARNTILEHHQIPLWNPYVEGGNVLLAHPHASWLSPSFVFVLIFGAVAGLKLQVFIHLLLGLVGMFWLCKQPGSRW